MDILAKARENLDNPATETLVRKGIQSPGRTRMGRINESQI